MSEPEVRPTPRHTGGCQCGAVRFAVYAEPIKTGICYCRMCQKAVAGPFAVLAEVPHQQFAWTRGNPASFRSSSRALRDFCATCGTPLSYRHPGGSIIELLTGAFDQPGRLPPSYATASEAMLPWLGDLARLPGRTSTANFDTNTEAPIVSFQHPDHDTQDDWQPATAPRDV